MSEQKNEIFQKMECLDKILDTLQEILHVLINKNEGVPETEFFALAKSNGKKWRTQWNTKDFPEDKEKNFLPSMTVPDQSMSVKTLMDRYARGLPLGGQKVPFYDEEEPVPDISKMDLAEQQELREQTAQEIKDIAFKYKKEQEEKKAKKDKKPDDHLPPPNKEEKSPTAPL